MSGGSKVDDNVFHQSPVSPPRILCKPRQGDDGEEDIWSGGNGEIKELSQGLPVWDVLHVVTLIIVFGTIVFGRIVTMREGDGQRSGVGEAKALDDVVNVACLREEV